MLDLLWYKRSAAPPLTRHSTIYLMKVLTWLGLNPIEKWRHWYYVYSLVIYILGTFYLPLSFGISFLLNASEMNTSQLLSSLQFALNILGLPIKVMVLHWNGRYTQQRHDIMNSMDSFSREEEDFPQLERCIRFGNRFAFFCAFIYNFSAFCAFCSSLAVGQPPYALYLPWLQWQRSRPELVVQALLELLLMSHACLQAAMTDVSPVIYIYIIRTHVQLLVRKLGQLGNGAKAESDVAAYEKLVNCIKYHQILLRFNELVTPLISIISFVQFAVTAAILCTTLINILLFADASTQIAAMLYLFSVMVQISPCCYQASCLLADSAQLPMAIAHCNWMARDKRFRQLLIFFIQRTQKPISFTALKLFPITLRTNVNIAKFSFSLYTLITEIEFNKEDQ